MKKIERGIERKRKWKEWRIKRKIKRMV